MPAHFCFCGTARSSTEDPVIAIMPIRAKALGNVELIVGFLSVATPPNAEPHEIDPEGVQLRSCRQCATVYAFTPPPPVPD